MATTFDSVCAGDSIDGPRVAVSRNVMRLCCEASSDNPLKLDDACMKSRAGFGPITRMITEWAYPAGATHRRLETRWIKPVQPGDTIQPSGIVRAKQSTGKSRWVLIELQVKNQRGEKVATGEARVEFPMDLFCQ